VHVEACADVPAVLRVVRQEGAQPGLALNPPTPLERVQPFLGLVDMLLVMTVHPGWGGQPIVDGWQSRIARARQLRAEAGAHFLIEVDGGIKPHNAHEALDAGADVLVAGSAVFESADYGATIRGLRAR